MAEPPNRTEQDKILILREDLVSLVPLMDSGDGTGELYFFKRERKMTFISENDEEGKPKNG